jgi:hypothetical protein
MVASLVREAGGAASTRNLRNRGWEWCRGPGRFAAPRKAAPVGRIVGLFWPGLGLASATGAALLVLGAVLAHLSLGIGAFSGPRSCCWRGRRRSLRLHQLLLTSII